MTTYIFALIGLATLCAFWAFFQQWLGKHDPDIQERANKCGGCNGQCKK
jgi:hypothetical protein